MSTGSYAFGNNCSASGVRSYAYAGLLALRRTPRCSTRPSRSSVAICARTALSVKSDLLAFTRDDGSVYTHGAFILIVAASIAAVGAMVTGFAQLPAIPPDSPAWKTAMLHMSVQMTTAVIFLVSLLLRLRHVDDAHPSIGAFICVIIGTGALFYGGWLGGHMVFSHGVSVAMRDDATALPMEIEGTNRADAHTTSASEADHPRRDAMTRSHHSSPPRHRTVRNR